MDRLRRKRTYPAALLAALTLACAGTSGPTGEPTSQPDVEELAAEVVRLYGAGRYDEAIPLAERALAIREKALGPEHPDVALSLNNLAALLYHAKGDFARAEPLYERALAIREKAQGSEHPDVALSLNNLAALYHAKGDYARAEPFSTALRNVQLEMLRSHDLSHPFYWASFVPIGAWGPVELGEE